jgi:ribosomal protein S18 acetylase RimI-like enzyme
MKLKKITIRKVKLSDVPKITAAAVDLLKYHKNIDPYYAPAKNVKEVYRKFLKRCIHSRNRHLLVAESGNTFVGFALGETGFRPPVFTIRKIGFISDMYIAKEYRRQGIARQFLLRLGKWFKSRKLKYIELTVHTKNEIAMKAWTKYGFQDYMNKRRIKLSTLKLK